MVLTRSKTRQLAHKDATKNSLQTKKITKTKCKCKSKNLMGKKQLKQENCMDNHDLLNPIIWKELPSALCDLVFAHLPINEIYNLQHLNKTWNQVISTKSSYISYICDKAHPTILFLFTRDSIKNSWLRTLDMKNNKWCTYRLNIIENPKKYSEDIGQKLYLHFIGGVHKRSKSYEDVIASAYNKQSLYVIWRRNELELTDNYYIEEYHQKEITSQEILYIKVHHYPKLEFGQFINNSNCRTTFYACEGYLMLLKTIRRQNQFRKDILCLYDRATCVWTTQHLPQLQLCELDQYKGDLLNSKWSIFHTIQRYAKVDLLV